jgi:hypothetical protein
MIEIDALEVQGQSCARRFKVQTAKKRPYKVSLFIVSNISDVQEDFGRKERRRAVKTSFVSPAHHKGIVLSTDFPRVPLYMPKMLTRTPSPLRKTRSKFSKLQQFRNQTVESTIPADVAMKASQKFKQAITNSLNKSINIAKVSVQQHKSPKIKGNEFHIKLPHISPIKEKIN